MLYDEIVLKLGQQLCLKLWIAIADFNETSTKMLQSPSSIQLVKLFLELWKTSLRILP